MNLPEQPEQKTASASRTLALCCLAPALLALLCYWRTRGYALVWDDVQILGDASVFASAETVRQWMFAPFLNYAAYFRPLALLSFAANYEMGEGSPAPFHLSNLLLHAANTLMLALLAAKLALDAGKAARVAGLAGLVSGGVYAIHPALIEGVSWIAARFDLLTAFFGLAALLTDRLFSGTLMRALLGALLFFCAALCKEMIAALFVLLPLWHWFAQGGEGSLSEVVKSPRNWPVYLAYAAAGCLYLGLRVHFMPAAMDSSMLAGMADPMSRLMLIGKTLARYLELALWPFPLIGPIQYLGPAPGLADGEAWLGWIALVAVIAVVIRARGLPRMLALLLACFLLALLPVSQWAPLVIGDSFAAERYLQFPLVFVALATGMLVTALIHSKGISLFACSALTALWLFLAGLSQLTMVPNWRNDDALWSYAYARAPLSKIATANLLSCLIERGDLDKAVAFAEKIRGQQNGQFYPSQQVFYAYLLSLRGQHAEALNYIHGADGANDADDRVAQLTLRKTWGQIAMNAGALNEALEQLQLAMAMAPGNADIRYYAGLALMALGRNAEGRTQLDQAYALAPEVAPQWKGAEAANVAVAVAKAEAYRRMAAPSE